MSNVPFNKFLQPVLKLAGESDRITCETAKAPVMRLLELPPEFAEERTPSGSITKISNRISWAFTYLKAAGLLDRVARGTYSITEEGRSVLDMGPRILDREFLLRYPSFREFLLRSRASSRSGGAPSPSGAVDSAPTYLRTTLLSEIAEETAPPVRGEGKPGTGGFSSGELLLPVLKALETLGEATLESVMASALELLSARRELSGGDPPDPAHPRAAERFETSAYYLRVAGYLRRNDRGLYSVTEEGRETLARDLDELRLTDLGDSPSYRAVRIVAEEKKRVDAAYEELMEQSHSETVARLRTMKKDGFKALARRIACGLAVRNGEPEAGATFRVLAAEDSHWEAEDIESFAGHMKTRRDGEWTLFTRGELCPKYQAIVRSLPMNVKICDESAAAALMFELGVGVTVRKTWKIRAIDQKYFDIITI
ncbi:MAG: hypothetical protein LBT40_00110 [Deltaproteobacteria bacterium]|jgi:restriction endonuclease Mrr|nr:hypothetical protein [Deltaproteobacteria bacterium]